VDSAGLHVAIPISKEVRDFLRKQDALDFLKAFPESIEQKRLRTFDLIVVMEPRHKIAVMRMCPDCTERIVVWNVRDPYFEGAEDVERIFIEIKNHVEKLAKSI
jgi:protein-tyrosine-phosphatase